MTKNFIAARIRKAADTLAYLPFIGLFIGLTWCFHQLFRPEVWTGVVWLVAFSAALTIGAGARAVLIHLVRYLEAKDV